uniref:Uncharacterized protein n=1 Tax=Oryza glumipatula TaxID=40148 RepID=A0A0E0B6D7_9ORYZ
MASDMADLLHNQLAPPAISMRGLFRAGSRGRMEEPILCSRARDDTPLVFLVLAAAVFHESSSYKFQRAAHRVQAKASISNSAFLQYYVEPVRRMAWEG